MKALSVRQPWAWALIFGGKPVENRTWRPPSELLGQRFLIHAAKGCTWDEYSYAKAWMEGNVLGPDKVPELSELPRGGIVGSAVLRAWADNASRSYHGDSAILLRRVLDSPWYFGPVGFLCEDRRPLPFIPCKGALGFWEVPTDVLVKVRVAGKEGKSDAD